MSNQLKTKSINNLYSSHFLEDKKHFSDCIYWYKFSIKMLAFIVSLISIWFLILLLQQTAFFNDDHKGVSHCTHSLSKEGFGSWRNSIVRRAFVLHMVYQCSIQVAHMFPWIYNEWSLSTRLGVSLEHYHVCFLKELKSKNRICLLSIMIINFFLLNLEKPITGNTN